MSSSQFTRDLRCELSLQENIHCDKKKSVLNKKIERERAKRYQFQLNYEETDDDDKLLMRRKSERSFF